MNNPGELLFAVAGVVLATMVAFGAYRWRQRARARKVEEWVKGYLVSRYGQLPDHLDINCTDDPLWPVLVAFQRSDTSVRHSLRFSCAGDVSSFFLLGEKEEPGVKAPSSTGHPPVSPARLAALPNAAISQS